MNDHSGATQAPVVGILGRSRYPCCVAFSSKSYIRKMCQDGVVHQSHVYRAYSVTPLYDNLPPLGGDDRRFRKCDGSAPAFFLQERSITPYHDLCDGVLTWFSLCRVVLAKILPAKNIPGLRTQYQDAFLKFMLNTQYVYSVRSTEFGVLHRLLRSDRGERKTRKAGVQATQLI